VKYGWKFKQVGHGVWRLSGRYNCYLDLNHARNWFSAGRRICLWHEKRRKKVWPSQNPAVAAYE